MQSFSIKVWLTFQCLILVPWKSATGEVFQQEYDNLAPLLCTPTDKTLKKHFKDRKKSTPHVLTVRGTVHFRALPYLSVSLTLIWGQF